MLYGDVEVYVEGQMGDNYVEFIAVSKAAYD
jgi:hypothetical protein